MADTFGLKIGLEGEKQFKQQLKEIEQSFKVLGSEMKLVDSQFDKNDKSVEALTARNAVLKKSIVTQKDKIETLRSALDNASKSFGENDSRTKAWQTKLNEAQAELNKMERELKDNASAIDKLGDGFQDSAKNADKFGDEVEEVGKKSDDAGSKFSSLGAIAGGIAAALAVAFAAVSAAAIKAGKSLIEMTKEGASYADNIITQSTVIGIATDKLQEYAYAAELVDVSLDTLTGSMKKNIMSMKSAASGSASYSGAYEKLGISVKDANGNLRDSETVYWELIEALGEIENDTERDALAMTLLGKSAQDLNPLIETGSKKMQELAKEAHQAGYVLSDELLQAYGAFDDQMQYLNNGVTAAKNALGTILLPLLTDLAEEGVSLLGEFTRGVQSANGDLSKIADVFGQVLPKALNVVMKYVPTIFSLIKEVVISIGKAIVDNLDLLIDSATEIILTILNALISGLPRIAEGALKLVYTLAKGILENLPIILKAVIEAVNSIASTLAKSLPSIIPSIVTMLNSVARTILDNLPSILKAVLEVIKGVAKGILNALPIIILTLPEIIKDVVDFIVEAIPEILNAVIEIVMAIVDALPTIIQSLIEALPGIIQAIIDGLLTLIPKIVECVFQFVFAVIGALPEIIEMLVSQLPQIIASIINTLLSNIPKIVETGVKLLTSLITNLPQIIIELVKAMPEIVIGMVRSLGEGVGQFIEVGKNLVKGLWEGIKSLASWIWDKVSNWAQDLWNGILNFFGIHSPSKKFAFVGNMMMKGLGEGIEGGGRFALLKADEMVKEVDGAFNRLNADIVKAPADYDINANIPSVIPSRPMASSNLNVGGASGAVSIEFHIDNFNNFSGDDIESLTEQILNTANAFLMRKGVAY
ncbi:MAG: phage tail protein [Bacilli bacterium]|nr:phage tail protein [Bacilli bacterium]